MLQENIDYYINEDGNLVFTREYHLKRGYCCKNKCLNCPWSYGRNEGKDLGDNPEKSAQNQDWQVDD